MLSQLLKKSPESFQVIAKNLYSIIPFNVRLGYNYHRIYDLLQQSQWWSSKQHEEYQMMQLTKLLNHAYQNVPYYRKVFDERALKPLNIQNFNDLKLLPFLTKQTILDNFDDMIATNIPEKQRYYATTGGTTGQQLKFYIHRNLSSQFEWAFMFSQWQRVGYDYKSSKRLVLRNNILPEGKLWVYDRLNNSLIFDPFHLSDDNIRKIIDKMNEVKIDFIHTYPSAITIICEFIKKTNYGLKYKPKAVLASSENVYPGQREFVEKYLETRFYSWYGHSEQLILAGECEHSNEYHIFPEYGITEIVDINNKNITEPNIKGELVGTGFNNYIMPFIRYKTDDWATYSEDVNCKCKRNYKKLKSVDGRWLQEMILTKSGNLISITALNMHSDIFDHVKQFQFYQDTKGICQFNIVKGENYSDCDEKRIYNELKKKLGDDIELKICYKDSIARAKSGKYRFLDQKLKTGFDTGESCCDSGE
ncbi:MAG: phenylacetate--CoA ligase family protein [Clostridiaceae bacterium]|nr:phenylacetate--CoA ligase family protein [Clostridiaceae bacterium]